MTAVHAETPTRRSHGDREPLPSVRKALLLLDSFRDAQSEIGVSELARRAGVPKSTAFRLLAHLEESGYLERVDRSYRLAWSVFELGNGVAACRPHGLRDSAMPFLVDLYTRTLCTVNLAVLEGSDVMYVEKIHSSTSVSTPAAVGQRRPATTTALGKALLAFSGKEAIQSVLAQPLAAVTRRSITQPGRLVRQLQEAHRLHLAHDNEESMLGVTCVASPVIVDGRAVAAISLSAPTTAPPSQQTSLLVRRTAAQLASAVAA